MSTAPYAPGGITGSDDRHYVSGPGDGFGYYSGTIYSAQRFSNHADATAAAVCCNEAYRQGFMAAQRSIREALGLKERAA